ncbi:MAG: SDR family oxidoreductase [Mycobacterium sp.]
MNRIVITGATAGIGLECAKALANGNHLVLIGRNPEKLRFASEAVMASGAIAVDTELCDFASLESVRQLASAIISNYEHIDVLINNAGAAFANRSESRDGYESTFAVNHLAPFLLTELLKPLLVRSAPSRVVITASAAHHRATLDFDDLAFRRRYNGIKAYSRSKLANVIHARELGRELTGSGVTANALHPGVVATDIWNDAPWYLQPLIGIARRYLMITPEEGGSRICYVATAPELATVTGEYFQDNTIRQPSHLARDTQVSQQLMAESARMVGLR